MRFLERIRIQASPALVWQVLAAVEQWPSWTTTMIRVQPLTADGLRLDARYRVLQPKLRPGIYEVTEYEPEKAFTWVQKIPGATMTAGHSVLADGGQTHVDLSYACEGLLGTVLGRLYGKTIAEYLAIEGRSLKARCESLAAQPPL